MRIMDLRAAASWIAVRSPSYQNQDEFRAEQWSTLLRDEGSDWVFTGADYNKTLAPGQRADFGYCVTMP